MQSCVGLDSWTVSSCCVTQSTRVRLIRVLFSSNVRVVVTVAAFNMGSLGDKATSPPIIDIRSDTTGFELKQLITSGLNAKEGEEKTLPTLLLYDDEGLRLFEEITFLDEYYLTETEIAILERYADRIAERIPDGSNVVELGSGYVAYPFLIDLSQTLDEHRTDMCSVICGRSRYYSTP